MAEEEGTTIRRVVPVGRGDGIVAYHVYHADAVTSASTIRQLRATVAAQALTIAGQDRVIAEQAAELAARPRWLVVRRPTWRAPGWALGPLALLACFWASYQHEG